MKKTISLLLIITLALLLCACNSDKAAEKSFSKAGMTITLTSDFTEKTLASQTAYYESDTAIVTALKEEFSLFEEAGISTGISLKEYADLCISANQIKNAEKIADTEKTYGFKHIKAVNGKDYTYFAYCFKSGDAFWLIQFACESSSADSLNPSFAEYANSVTFD